MNEDRIYTTGEFARRANVSVRTIRYYDDKGILKPTIIKDSGYRFYKDSDFVELQKIIVLKRLGFSLDDISAISYKDDDVNYIKESINLQLNMIREKMIELKQIEQCILEVSQTFSNQMDFDWNKIISLIHLICMEETLEKQYKNSKNIDARIELHKRFSNNKQGWYHWIYNNLHLKDNMKILEIGCGNGQLWKENIHELPSNLHVVLSDISSGMLRSARLKLKGEDDIFEYKCFDCNEIPYDSESFDIVIANHVLFYAKDRRSTFREILRVLKKGGALCCSTYGQQHMKEIELLVKEYDERINLSEIKLYDIFGLDNGYNELNSMFQKVDILKYDDSLLVTEIQPLIDYIYSCHGNQMKYLNGQNEKFEKFIGNKIGNKGLRVMKDVGLFRCIK
jgi:ubiquinone/menaquinone biosynthesis C-methylase UbiE